MVSAKRLSQLAKKWQRMAALERKRLTTKVKDNEGCCISVTVKGNCVMYTADGRCFNVPLVYLSTTIFSELLRTSHEEFGFASDGKIALPCDAGVMEYVLCLLRINTSVEVQNALLSSMVASCHYTGCAIPTVGAKQSLYEDPTGPSEGSNIDGYNYSDDLNVDPTSDMYGPDITYGGWDE